MPLKKHLEYRTRFLPFSIVVLCLTTASLTSPAIGAWIPVTGSDDPASNITVPGAELKEPALQPSLSAFSSAVTGGAGNAAAGVYVRDVLALRVTQQPHSNPGYVSGQFDEVTQFSLASSNRTLGFLAHNYLAGERFFELRPGQTAVVIGQNGSRQRFRIDTVWRYQALSPTSPQSEFLELDGQGRRLSALQLFNLMYSVPDQLVFQTCIEVDGNLTWGRLFVVASRVEIASPDIKLNRLEAVLLQPQVLGIK